MSRTISGTTVRTGYLYNADGVRVAKGLLSLTQPFTCDTNSGDSTYNGFTVQSVYILGPGGEQMTEMAIPSGQPWNWAHTNIFGGGLDATYHSDSTGTTAGVLYFHLSDWLGSRHVQTDYAGNPVESYQSLPYGDGPSTTLLAGAPTSRVDSTEHHFTGKERDSESGNDYFGARYYASSMGRFMSPDWSAKEEPVPSHSLTTRKASICMLTFEIIR